jgi:ABC-type multidrug transport system ATPase subunit
MSTCLSISALQVSRGGATILHDVHLTLETGEIYGLLGPNGAGKSTTIAAVLGLLARDAGEVRILGVDPAEEAVRVHRLVGALPEQNGFYGWMTALDYLRFFDRLYGRSSGVLELQGRLTQVALLPRDGQRIATFSHGMRQRLGLARALLGDPAVLILDEPTNGLDPRGRREIHDILLALAERGVGILLCTHLLDDVERLCHRVGIIVRGRTVAEGSIGDLVKATGSSARFRLRLEGGRSGDQPHNPHMTVLAREGQFCEVELKPGLAPEQAWRELLERGWPITEIRREGSGLEDVYFDLTEGSAAWAPRS